MPVRPPNKQYNVALPGSLPVRIATFQRHRMYRSFLQLTQAASADTILDVGVTSDRTYASSNYLEAWYTVKSNITAVGLDDASFLRQLYPGMQFLRADGLALPFKDASFDLVHSSAVLEHVGGFDRQVRLIAECARVARKAIFLTTPNRFFPIEFHTLLPLLHWLPKRTYRVVLRRLGFGFFADERNLNLMSARELMKAANCVEGITVSVMCERLAGWPSNLLLLGHKALG